MYLTNHKGCNLGKDIEINYDINPQTNQCHIEYNIYKETYYEDSDCFNPNTDEKCSTNKVIM